MSEQRITAYLGLGSNLGDREHNLKETVRLLGEEMIIKTVSSLYITRPVGYAAQPDFINAACEVATLLPAKELFKFIKRTEITMGRMPNFLNGPRVIDIDILLYGDEIINTPQLVVPHLRMAERTFVLVPLAEIAAETVHPVNHKTIRELLTALGQIEGVRHLSDNKNLNT